MIGLQILAGLVALAWSGLAARLIGRSRGEWLRFLGPVEGMGEDFPPVDAIVPARNEEDHVEATLRALRAQEYAHLAITIVDDQSTDRTGAILDRLASGIDGGAPIRVVRGVERPEGWVGKTWAVHQGVARSRADWIWFVDADMGLHPKALASAMREAERTKADFVSLLPGVRCTTFWQGAIATSFVQLLAQLYPLDRVNDPTRTEAIAAGGFILVRRSTYDRAGGHESCRREIVEDVQLARRIKEAGGRLAVRLAPDLAWTHMYGRFGDIWRGLRKNAYAGMDYMPHKFVTGFVVALAMAWLPWAALIAGLMTGSSALLGIGVWGIFAQATAAAPVAVFLGLPAPFAFSMPAGISAYVAIASASVWHHHRGRILWKGRVLSSAVVGSGPTP